jgi:hypothetical protein
MDRDETVVEEWNKLIKPCYVKLMRRPDDKSLEAKSKSRNFYVFF